MDIELLKRRAIERIAQDDVNSPDTFPWIEIFDAANVGNDLEIAEIIRRYPGLDFIGH